MHSKCREREAQQLPNSANLACDTRIREWAHRTLWTLLFLIKRNAIAAPQRPASNTQDQEERPGCLLASCTNMQLMDVLQPTEAQRSLPTEAQY